MKKTVIALCFSTGLLFLAEGCTKDNNKEASSVYNWDKHIPFESDYEVSFVPDNLLYVNDPVNLGALQLEEASGIAPGVVNPGTLWVHEDGGNGNFVYLIDAVTAEILCSYRIGGATNIDWEDIETVKDPVTGKSYLYIADTGDNEQRRSSATVYKVEEPVYTAADKGKILTTDATLTERVPFQYIDGSKDVESMFVDKDTKDIYLVTKRDTYSRLYVIPFPYNKEQISKAIYAGSFGFKEASAATVNAATDKFIVRNRQHLFYWERKSGEKIWETLKRVPERLPFTGEVQGEAVCFDTHNNYYTTSEKAGYTVYPPVYKYVLK